MIVELGLIKTNNTVNVNNETERLKIEMIKMNGQQISMPPLDGLHHSKSISFFWGADIRAVL